MQAKIKLRVLYYTNKGRMKALANEICSLFEAKMDTIPPAYNCEKERLVFIGATLGKSVPDQLRLFCAELNKSRAANVAFFIDGPEQTAEELKEHVRNAGANVIGETLYFKGGLPFLSGIKPEEKKQITEWAQKLHDELAAE